MPIKPNPDVEVVIMVRQPRGAYGQAVYHTTVDHLLEATSGGALSPEVRDTVLVPAFLEAAVNVIALHRRSR